MSPVIRTDRNRAIKKSRFIVYDLASAATAM